MVTFVLDARRVLSGRSDCANLRSSAGRFLEVSVFDHTRILNPSDDGQRSVEIAVHRGCGLSSRCAFLQGSNPECVAGIELQRDLHSNDFGAAFANFD